MTTKTATLTWEVTHGQEDWDYIAHIDEYTVTLTAEGDTWTLDISTGYGPDIHHVEVTGLPSVTAAKQEAYKTIRPIRVDDIFVSSWGYDQTNIDYFKVVEVSPTGKTVKVIQIGTKLTGETSGTSDVVVPDLDRPIERWVREPTDEGSWANVKKIPDPKRRTVKWTAQGKPFFKVYSYANAYLWHGQPNHQTNPMFGH